MRTITFTEEVQYENEGRRKGPTFKKGVVLRDIPEDFAERWLRRGVAVDGEVKLEDEPKPSQKPGNEDTTPKRLPGAATVEIPDNYQDLKADELKALAALLSTAQPRTKADAIVIVEAELELRTNPGQ